MSFSKMSEFNQVIQSLEGRDKVNAMMQECAKFIFYALTVKSASPDFANRMKSLGDGVSLCRSVDRLFNGGIQLENAMKIAKGDDIAFVKYSRMAIVLGYVAFFYYDNKIFLGLIGVLKNLDYAHLGGRAMKIWFWCLFLTIFLLILKVQNDDKEDKATKLSLYASCCDIIVAGKGAGYIPVNDGLANALGFYSAYLGYKRICLTLK